METVAQLERQLRRDMEQELNRIQNILGEFKPLWEWSEGNKILNRVAALKDRSRELDKTRLD